MIYEIIKYGDPLLEEVSSTVKKLDSKLLTLIDDMIETMYAANGIGLSAIQIGIKKRIFVMEIPEYHKTPQVFINPVIERVSHDIFEYREGCLSIPGVLFEVVRPRSVVLSYRDAEFKEQSLIAEELTATCIQHEMDHLDGKLFIDRVTGRANQKKLSEALIEQGYEVSQSV